MNTTAKALIVSTTITLSVLAAAHVALPPQVVKLDAVVVTATRADMLTAQLKDVAQHASATTRKGG